MTLILGKYSFIIVIAKVYRGNYTESLKKVYHSIWNLCLIKHRYPLRLSFIKGPTRKSHKILLMLAHWLSD